MAVSARFLRPRSSSRRRASVGPVIHVSITNPALDSPFEYFRGKAALEGAIRATGLPHSTLRPAVLFGGPDILVTNIAWLLRRIPHYGVFGDGNYRLQPIHVEDFAKLVEQEIGALMDGLLATESAPTGNTRLSEWVVANADTLGARYANELARRRDREAAYAAL